MKHIYLDTSVLLARWAPLDPHHAASLTIITAIRDGKIAGYISDFSLVEIATVVERQQEKFAFKAPPKTKLALEYIKKIRLIPNLTLINTSRQSNIVIAGQQTSLSTVYWRSIDVAITTQLKTLDTLHLAIAASMLALQERNVDFFVTADLEILKKKDLINQHFDFGVVGPKELLKTERL